MKATTMDRNIVPFLEAIFQGGQGAANGVRHLGLVIHGYVWTTNLSNPRTIWYHHCFPRHFSSLVHIQVTAKDALIGTSKTLQCSPATSVVALHDRSGAAARQLSSILNPSSPFAFPHLATFISSYSLLLPSFHSTRIAQLKIFSYLDSRKRKSE